MKDRQPTQVLSNGAIRYGIYNADGTLDHYEYMKREDAPTVEGTPLNKANLLSDDAAMKIWPDAAKRPEDPTVSEALVELKKGSTKIGDIKITSREIDSSAWLLCDGQSVTKNAYPELFQMLRPSAAPTDFVQQEVSGVSMNTGNLCHVNGKWISFTSTDAYGSFNMFVSEDTQAWQQYRFNATELKNSPSDAKDVCYSAINNAYYLIFWGKDTSLLCKLSSDFTTLTYLRNINSSYTFTKYTNYRRNSWEMPDGRICFALTWQGESVSSSTQSISDGRLEVYSPNSNSVASYNTGSADYNAESNQLLYMYGRSVYASADPSDKSSAALVGEIPTSIISSNSGDFMPLICAATNTIVVFYRLYSTPKYAYSTDKGATWHDGTEIVGSFNQYYNFTFVNGVLVFCANDCTCSILTPPDQVYVTQGIYANCALSEDGLAVTPPSNLSSSPPYSCVYVRDYNDAAKKLPTIIPSAQSRAYIKALEE